MREWEKPGHPSKMKKKCNYETPYCSAKNKYKENHQRVYVYASVREGIIQLRYANDLQENNKTEQYRSL